MWIFDSDSAWFPCRKGTQQYIFEDTLRCNQSWQYEGSDVKIIYDQIKWRILPQTMFDRWYIYSRMGEFK